jgi:hypothetical protein
MHLLHEADEHRLRALAVDTSVVLALVVEVDSSAPYRHLLDASLTVLMSLLPRRAHRVTGWVPSPEAMSILTSRGYGPD